MKSKSRKKIEQFDEINFSKVSDIVSKKVILSDFAYFCLSDVKEIYLYFNCGFDGLESFLNKAKKIAVKNGCRYEFRNETILFQLLKEKFKAELEELKINSWDELINYIS